MKPQRAALATYLILEVVAMRHVIIGAGEAGLRAAIALRTAGEQDVVLVNGEDLPSYERPSLSKPDSVMGFHRPISADLSGIDVLFGKRALHIERASRKIRLTDGDDLDYDRLLIATGARPRKLPVAPAGVVFELRTVVDAHEIYGRARSGGNAVIIGAGLIGLEMAAELVRRGMNIIVVEAGPRALGRAIPAAIAEVVVDRHVEAGVNFHFAQSIGAITGKSVLLATGDVLPADLIIAAIGVEPNIELASAAGLPCANGVITDRYLKTPDDAIYAAGDCAAIDHPRYGIVRFETWRNAVDQGTFAAKAMLGSSEPFIRLPWFWSDHHDLGLQGVGFHVPSRTAIRRELPDGGFLHFETDSDGTLQAAFGIGFGNAVAKDIRLAEKLIERSAIIPAENLSDQHYPLKSALR